MLAMICLETMILDFGDIDGDSGLVSWRHGDSVEMLLSLRHPLWSPEARPRLMPSKKTILTWSRLSLVVIS